MKGVTGAGAIKTSYGTYKIFIEAKDQKTYEKLVRKLRLIGIYIYSDKVV